MTVQIDAPGDEVLFRYDVDMHVGPPRPDYPAAGFGGEVAP